MNKAETRPWIDLGETCDQFQVCSGFNPFHRNCWFCEHYLIHEAPHERCEFPEKERTRDLLIVPKFAGQTRLIKEEAST